MLVIFDLDGTLVDSQHEIVAAQARAFAAHGLPAPTRAKALSVVGLSLTEAFRVLAGADGPLESLAEAYKAAWADLRQRPGYSDNLYPGAEAAIAALRDAGLTLGIATGKSRRGVDRILAARGWTDLFATVQTADTHPSKPDPSMVLTALAETGAEPSDSLMIGDTTYDIEMAVAAGVTPIGVAWGYHPAEMLVDAGAARVVATFDELLQSIETRTVTADAR